MLNLTTEPLAVAKEQLISELHTALSLTAAGGRLGTDTLMLLAEAVTRRLARLCLDPASYGSVKDMIAIENLSCDAAWTWAVATTEAGPFAPRRREAVQAIAHFATACQKALAPELDAEGGQ